MKKSLLTLFAAALPVLALAQTTRLDNTQLGSLCTAVKLNSAANAARALGDTVTLTAVLDTPANPVFVVERTSITRHEILTGTSSTGSTFQWAGAGYITRSQGERDAFREMFNSTGTVNPSLPSIKAAFNDIFSGAGGASNRAHITAMSKRSATFLERVFVTGTGTDAVPGSLVVEGPANDVTVSWLVNPATCN